MGTVNQPEKRPLYHTWRAMIRRCEEPSATGYEYYGGRGITVCAGWHDYKTFEKWILANLGPRPEGCTLDRIRNNGSYRPGNVRWATWSEQNRNRRPMLQEYKEWQAGWADVPVPPRGPRAPRRSQS